MRAYSKGVLKILRFPDAHGTLARLLMQSSTHTQSQTTKPAWDELIVAARAGDDEALGAIMADLHSYLLTVADDNLGDRLRAKFGPSDIVQQSFFEAQQAMPSFHGSSEEEIRAWLKKIVMHNLVDSARRYTDTQARDIERETYIDRRADEAVAWDGLLCPASKTPSFYVSRSEIDEQMMEAVVSLPASQRRVVESRHRWGRSYQQISTELGISENAARSLWTRAMTNLREKLVDDDGQSQRRTKAGPR